MTIDTAALPRHEEEILWSSVLRCARKDLYLGTAPAPNGDQIEEFHRLVLRRLDGEPLQYLTGVQGFRMLELIVGPGTLVPRPETEIVVERCLELLDGVDSPKVIDVGTGSAAIALAIATERPDSEVWATDASDESLRWARTNVARVGAANVHLVAGDLFGSIPARLRGCVDIVVSNPPYLSEAEIFKCDPDVADHEPRIATVAGPTGMELYPRLARESLKWLRNGGWLVLETAETLWGRLRCVLPALLADVDVRRDLAGRIRVAEGRKL